MTGPQCRFCDSLTQPDSAPWNRVLLQTEHFAVVPTLGALVEGWLLIVSREHRICMGALTPPERAELETLVGNVAAILRRRYGPVALFEHGPVQTGQQVGCGVDHAHLHLVPTTCALLAGSLKYLPPHVSWASADGLASIYRYYEAGLPYLYLEQNGSAHIATAPNLPSQLFRKVLAEHSGHPARWNWREFAFGENVAATVQSLGGRLAAR